MSSGWPGHYIIAGGFTAYYGNCERGLDYTWNQDLKKAAADFGRQYSNSCEAAHTMRMREGKPKTEHISTSDAVAKVLKGLHRGLKIAALLSGNQNAGN